MKILNADNRRMIYMDKIDVDTEFQFMAYSSIDAWKQLYESKEPLYLHY